MKAFKKHQLSGWSAGPVDDMKCGVGDAFRNNIKWLINKRKENVWVEIGLRGRSMFEILQVASKEVRVPADDIQKGKASADQPKDLQSSTDASDWLVIKSSNSRPSGSSLSIQYKGHWFYIDDTDLQSRETFSMLTALFAVVGGTVPGAHPVLTLPVAR